MKVKGKVFVLVRESDGCPMDAYEDSDDAEADRKKWNTRTKVYEIPYIQVKGAENGKSPR